MTIIQLSLWASKVCRRCGFEKPYSEFGRSKQNKDGLLSYCRQCHAAKTLEWKRKNIEAHRAITKKGRQKNKQTIRESQKRCRLENPERYRTYYSAYQKENARRYADHSNIRFHQQRGNGGSHTQEEWRQLCEQFDNRCACCGRKTRLTKDHIIPVTQGGTSDIDNLQPLCQSCNSCKGRKIIDYRVPLDPHAILE